MSKQLIKTLSRKGITFNDIIDVFFTSSKDLISFLVSGRNPFIKKKNTANKIVEFLENFKNIINHGIEM